MLAYEAIADPMRRGILDLLRERELPAGQIARHFPVSRPAVSRHLRVLRSVGLVNARRRGRLVVYRLDASPLAVVGAWLKHYERFWAEGLSSLKQYLEDESGTDAAHPPQHGDGTDATGDVARGG